MPEPPHDIQAEACVLGSMILHGPAVDIVVGLVGGSDFYRPAHEVIFDALVGLHEATVKIDLVTLRDALQRQKQLETVGGVDYLVALAEGVPSAANAEYYAGIVRDHAMRRNLLSAAENIAREARNSTEEAQNIVDQAEAQIFAIAQKGVTRAATTMEGLLKETFERINSGNEITGIPSGFPALDSMTTGFRSGEMIIVAARPSMGKTSLLMNFAEYMAVIDHRPVALFSLEMGASQIAERMLASHARYNLRGIRRGMIDEQGYDLLLHASRNLSAAPLYIDDSPSLTILQLRAKARRLKAEHGIEAVLVDYLQLMSHPGRAESRQQQIAEISQGIKALARELDVPVIAAAQLNRGVEGREDKRPRMSDLRESGSIEQDADVVALLHSEDYYHRGDPNHIPNGETELIVAKQRNGPTGTVSLHFWPEFTKFEQRTA